MVEKVKKKVVFYLPTPGGLTGAPRRLLTLCESLSLHPILPCLMSESESEIMVEAEAAGIHCQAFSCPSDLGGKNGSVFQGSIVSKVRMLAILTLHNLRFLKRIKQSSFDLVWLRSSKGVAFGGLGAFLSRRPLIWDVDYEWPSRGAIRLLHRFGLFISSKVIFQYSEAAVRIFGKSLADKYAFKFKTIIPGINLSRIEPFRVSREQRSGESSCSSCFSILQVGTICDRKNQVLIVEAVREVLLTCKVPLKVYFAGSIHDPTYFNDLRALISEYDIRDAFVFLGWCDNVHELMGCVDLLVMPSKDEGVPNAVQEAMYIGLPVLVSKAGGMPEIVEDNVTGWVRPCHSHKAWADAISMCIADVANLKRVSANAACYARKEFASDKWVESYVSVCEAASGRMN